MKNSSFLFLIALSFFINAMASEEKSIEAKDIISLLKIQPLPASYHSYNYNPTITVPCIGGYFDSAFPISQAPHDYSNSEVMVTVGEYLVYETYKQHPESAALNQVYKIPSEKPTEQNILSEKQKEEKKTLQEESKNDLFKLQLALRLLTAPKNTCSGCVIITNEPKNIFDTFLQTYQTFQKELTDVHKKPDISKRTNLAKDPFSLSNVQFPEIQIIHHEPLVDRFNKINDVLKGIYSPKENKKTILIVHTQPKNTKSLEDYKERQRRDELKRQDAKTAEETKQKQAQKKQADEKRKKLALSFIAATAMAGFCAYVYYAGHITTMNNYITIFLSNYTDKLKGIL